MQKFASLHRMSENWGLWQGQGWRSISIFRTACQKWNITKIEYTDHNLPYISLFPGSSSNSLLFHYATKQVNDKCSSQVNCKYVGDNGPICIAMHFKNWWNSTWTRCDINNKHCRSVITQPKNWQEWEILAIFWWKYLATVVFTNVLATWSNCRQL